MIPTLLLVPHPNSDSHIYNFSFLKAPTSEKHKPQKQGSKMTTWFASRGLKKNRNATLTTQIINRQWKHRPTAITSHKHQPQALNGIWAKSIQIEKNSQKGMSWINKLQK